MADLSIYETFDGGDVVLFGSDLQLVNSLWNQPYLAMFGGNIEQSHGDDAETQGALERFDYWGNDLLLPDNLDQQFNSEFEREIDRTAINSAGRQRLETVLKEDLRFMKELANPLEVSVRLIKHDTLFVKVSFTEPDNLQQRNFIFLWNGTRLEQLTNIQELQALNELYIGEGEFAIGVDQEVLLFL